MNLLTNGHFYVYSRSKETGIQISDDPTEVNTLCLVLDGLGVLQDCPVWGQCNCAVCNRVQAEMAEPKRAKALD